MNTVKYSQWRTLVTALYPASWLSSDVDEEGELATVWTGNGDKVVAQYTPAEANPERCAAAYITMPDGSELYWEEPIKPRAVALPKTAEELLRAIDQQEQKRKKRLEREDVFAAECRRRQETNPAKS